MKKQKLWNYLADNGFGFLFIIFISLSIHTMIRIEWAISKVIEAYDYSVAHGILVGFGFSLSFIALGVLTYITQKEYENY